MKGVKTMPMVKGAKFNVKTGKYTMPKDYKNQAKIREEVVKAKGPSKRKVTEIHRTGAKQRKDSTHYAIFALYPSGRAFLAYHENPTHDALGKQFGGGEYQVCERDRDSGEWVGEPVQYPIDRTMFPPKLTGFMAPQIPGMMGGFPPMPGMMGGGFPGMPPQMPSADNEELEDELEELKEQIAQLRQSLIAKDRQLEDAKREADAEKVRSFQEKMLEEIRGMGNRLAGEKKSPLDSIIELKRFEAELQGPLKPGGGATDQVAGVIAMLDLVDALKKRTAPTEESGGGAGAGFLEVIKAVGPLIQQAKEMQSNAPAPAPVPAPEPSPESNAVMAAATPAFRMMVAKMGELIKAEAAPAVFAAWFDFQDDAAFKAAKEVTKVEQPEGFLGVVGQVNPDLLTEENKAWIVEAMVQAQQAILK